MDIDLLSKMVKELILDNDEVTLPGVGTFVTEIIPSTFSDKGYTINPPYRRLYFRQKQNEEDTQLSDFYAKSNNIDKETAKKIICEFLKEMKEILLHKRIIVFPGLGRLRATKENNLFFIADEELDIYPEGFGLESISLKTHQETTEEVSQAIEDLKSIIDDQPAEPVVEEPVSEVVEEVTLEEKVAEVPAEEIQTEEVQTEEIPTEEVPTEEVPTEEVQVEEVQKEEVQKEDVQTEEVQIEEIPTEEVLVEEAVPEVEEVVEETVEETPVVEVVKDVEEDVAENAEEAAVTEKPTEKTEEKPKKKGLRTAVWIIIIVLVVCILALLAFIIVGHVAPELIDKLLYSPEELEIINNF